MKDAHARVLAVKTKYDESKATISRLEEKVRDIKLCCLFRCANNEKKTCTMFSRSNNFGILFTGFRAHMSPIDTLKCFLRVLRKCILDEYGRKSRLTKSTRRLRNSRTRGDEEPDPNMYNYILLITKIMTNKKM